MCFSRNSVMWRMTPLVVSPWSLLLTYIPDSEMQGVYQHPRPLGLQVPRSGLRPPHLLPEPWFTSHHLTLFSFLAQTLFSSSVKVPFVPLLQEVIIDPLGALKDFYIYLPTYLPCLIQCPFCSSTSLNSRAWSSGTVSCSLVSPQASVPGTW